MSISTSTGTLSESFRTAAPAGSTSYHRASATARPHPQARRPSTPLPTSDLVCFSHLRWDFVFQRPQHLLSRFARERRVFFVEEPVYGGDPGLDVSHREDGLHVVTPRLSAPLPPAELHEHLRMAVDRLFLEHAILDHMLWVYTPMAMPFISHLTPSLVVFDCMDELSAFDGAPAEMRRREDELLAWADLVFTGGQSLYEAKRDRHPRVHLFPSSIDREHFGQARSITIEPEDQAGIPRPRIGFFGVIDERLDRELLDGIARARPDRQFVIVGPVVKIDPATLPRHPNLHYLGRKQYAELPAYLAGWDVAMLPFAHNQSTRFISPTKTPEYLAAGCPVVSTSIADVVRPYGERGLVHIADGVEAFTAATTAALRERNDRVWQRAVDAFLRGISWDRTWTAMRELMDRAAVAKGRAPLHAAG